MLKKHWSIRCRNWVFLLSSPLVLVFLFGLALPEQKQAAVYKQTIQSEAATVVQDIALPQRETLEEIHLQLPPPMIMPESHRWQQIDIKRGDNLSLIFSRLKLSPTDLHHIITLNTDTARLKHIMPGQGLAVMIRDGRIHKLRYEPDILTTLVISRTDDTSSFTSDVTTIELDTRIVRTEGRIDDSLFLAGQAAGLSDKVIMQMVGIYGWDIDFVLDIRRGDHFKLVYEEKYKQDIKVGDGPILVAEFTNQKKVIKAVRYQNTSGQHDYYTENGDNMRKAFLRTPLKFNRISSGFNLRRKHPILNTIRAHRGVDYAAPTGTPVKATGDGSIHYIGRKGGYGKTIILRHGGKYSTLYAHLSNYSRGMRRGKSVRQGEIIGYVGSTGLATGPHLHYEFQLNGVHRNPLTVKLPKADSIPANELDRFHHATTELFAMLDSSETRFARSDNKQDVEVLALSESEASHRIQ